MSNHLAELLLPNLPSQLMDLSVGRRLVVNIYLVFSSKFYHVSHTIFRSSRPKALF